MRERLCLIAHDILYDEAHAKARVFSLEQF